MSYCNWGNASDVTQRYHGEEWGMPVHDDVKQFEYLMMEVMQCGLSWDLMMKKREIFRIWFENIVGDTSTVSLSLPEAGRCRVILVKLNESKI